MAALNCKTCHHPLPEGKEHPDYFGRVSIGYGPGDEGDWHGEDLGQVVRYLKTVHEALSDVIDLAELADDEPLAEKHSLMDAGEYLDHADSLSFLFNELLEEAERNAKLLHDWVRRQIKEKEDVAK